LTPAWGPSPQMNTACHWRWAMVFCENSSEVYGGGKCPRVHEYMNLCFVMFFWKICAPRANDLPWFSRLILYIHKYIYMPGIKRQTPFLNTQIVKSQLQ
jgi:hypothetical protein